MITPVKLYKYRKFDVNTLRMLTKHETFYSDPGKFNDPMDCNSTFTVDNCSPQDLCKLYRKIAEGNPAHQVDARINHAIGNSQEYGNWQTESEARSYLIESFRIGIKEVFLEELRHKGVLSLAESWTSPLMWSHYGDEHRGVCIEYDTTEQQHSHLAPVNYNASRSISLRDLFDWKVGGSDSAQTKILNTYFYSKARDWSYEKEWRDLNDKAGNIAGRFRISAVYFGFRCDEAVKVAVVKMLDGNERVELFDVNLNDSDFTLIATEVERDEKSALGMQGPAEIEWRQALVGLEDFEPPPPQVITDQV